MPSKYPYPIFITYEKIIHPAFLIRATALFAQTDSIVFINEVKQFQQELNKAYNDYAKFTPVQNPLVFNRQTTSGRALPFVKFGAISFMLDGKEHKLAIYQSVSLRQKNGYENHLQIEMPAGVKMTNE